MNTVLFVPLENDAYLTLETLARRAHVDVDSAASGAMRLYVKNFKTGATPESLSGLTKSAFPEAGAPAQPWLGITTGFHLVEVTFDSGNTAIAHHLQANREEFATRLTEAIAFANRCLDVAGVPAEPPLGAPHQSAVRRIGSPVREIRAQMPPRTQLRSVPPTRHVPSPPRCGYRPGLAA